MNTGDGTERMDYGWRRFWRPSVDAVARTSEGFLVDPEMQVGGIQFANHSIVPFEAIAHEPCLVLLGEPGIGKTTELDAQRKRLAARSSARDALLFLYLRDYQTDAMLCQDLFGHPLFQSWLQGSGLLTLFLDGLDEGLLSIRQLATLLPSQLSRYPVERLRLRITCRTAEWPAVLEAELKRLWGKPKVGVYELAPLRWQDVVAAARAKEVPNVDTFMAEIERRGLGPFAAKPVTLDLLLNLYTRQGSFPGTQEELYLKGCALLCEEANDGRIAARQTGQLDASRRLAIAARIAAVTIFAGRAAVWTAVDRGNVPQGDITVRALSGGYEYADGTEFPVGEGEIREALSTGLFISRGSNRLGWAHQSYAEFLAAWYLVRNGVQPDQMIELLLHSDGRVAPQLHEATARLATLVPAVFRAIMRMDPPVLLRSDLASADESDRADLVAALLEASDTGQLFDHVFNRRTRYEQLAHPGLARQLQPYIVERTRNQDVRRLAIDIAEACECREVQRELAAIALDVAEPLRLREKAVLAITRIGDNETRALLRPLAINEIVEDEDDELKGVALSAVWPDHLSVDELFGTLKAPKNAGLFGNYEIFCARELVQRLRPADLPVALRWVSTQPSRDEMPFGFHRLLDGIMLRAWDHLEEPGVLPAFASAALSRVRQHDSIAEDRDERGRLFQDLLLGEDDKRQRVLEAILPLLTNPDNEWVRLVHSETPLATDRDLTWMLGCLRMAETWWARRLWSILIARVFSFYENTWTAELVDMVVTACEEHRTLAAELSGFLTPVELGSLEAQRKKESFEL